MRVFKFFTSIGFLATVSCVFTEPDCPKDDETDEIILLPNPEMCTTYWACRRGWAILNTCPFGKVFDGFKLSCEDSKTTLCSVDFPTTKKPLPPLPTEKSPMPSVMTTVKSFHSSPITAKPTSSSTITTIRPPATMITTVKPTPSAMTTVKSTSSSTIATEKPTRPSATTAETILPSITTTITPSMTTTVRPTLPSKMTTIIPLLTSSTTHDGITARPPMEDSPINCPPWYWPSNEYLLPNPKDCHTFYKCIHGTPHLYVCEDNLHFNSELKVCDWPNDVEC